MIETLYGVIETLYGVGCRFREIWGRAAVPIVPADRR
jgi:hypothetical protein